MTDEEFTKYAELVKYNSKILKSYKEIGYCVYDGTKYRCIIRFFNKEIYSFDGINDYNIRINKAISFIKNHNRLNKIENLLNDR